MAFPRQPLLFTETVPPPIRHTKQWRGTPLRHTKLWRGTITLFSMHPKMRIRNFTKIGKVCNVADLSPGKICNERGKICNVANLPPWGKVCNVADLPGGGVCNTTPASITSREITRAYRDAVRVLSAPEDNRRIVICLYG